MCLPEMLMLDLFVDYRHSVWSVWCFLSFSSLSCLASLLIRSLTTIGQANNTPKHTCRPQLKRTSFNMGAKISLLPPVKNVNLTMTIHSLIYPIYVTIHTNLAIYSATSEKCDNPFPLIHYI